MAPTTDLNKLINQVSPNFTWGKIIKFHTIGRYVLAEYLKSDNNAPRYFGWVDGKSSGRDWSSLEEGIVGCIAYAYEGPNSAAGEYFMRMITNARA